MVALSPAASMDGRFLSTTRDSDEGVAISAVIIAGGSASAHMRGDTYADSNEKGSARAQPRPEASIIFVEGRLDCQASRARS
jgi:hypothetical protein